MEITTKSQKTASSHEVSSTWRFEELRKVSDKTPNFWALPFTRIPSAHQSKVRLLSSLTDCQWSSLFDFTKTWNITGGWSVLFVINCGFELALCCTKSVLLTRVSRYCPIGCTLYNAKGSHLQSVRGVLTPPVCIDWLLPKLGITDARQIYTWPLISFIFKMISLFRNKMLY